MMSNILYDVITRRAEETFSEGAITPENFRFYAVHWLQTAERFREECAANDLRHSAMAIADIIEANIKWLTPAYS
jgi:hypothetical protein